MNPRRFDSLCDVDAFVDAYPKPDPASDDLAYYRSLRVYDPAEYDSLRPSWHGGSYRQDRRAEGGRPLPAPTLAGLSRHAEKFTAGATAAIRSTTPTAVRETKTLYRLDGDAGLSEAERRAERRRRLRKARSRDAA